METKKETVKSQNISDHLANERTFLAWIRTSIGIMAFGFVVVKFSLFIRQITILLGKNAPLPTQNGYSALIGISLVVIGAVILLLSFLKYKKTERQISDASFHASSSLLLLVTIFVLIVSALLILYLVQNSSINFR